MPDWVKLEHEVLDFWKESNAFEKLVAKNEGKPVYRALDGPITANNSMGIHHVWGRTLKDIYLKYKAMKGFAPRFQNGFDCHGLPVEVEVEKEIGTKNKKDILDYGMQNFVQKCGERVDKYAGLITEQSIRLGQWMDWDNSYFTNTDENITSIWAFLKKVSDNGWLKTQSRPMQWCPRCGTSLSAHEMHGSYKDVEHEAVFFKAPVKGQAYSMLVWTTTPWTLTSNVAIAVNPDNDYLEVKVKSDKRTIIVGKEAVKVLKDDAVEVLREFKGAELVGKTYETCFPELEVQQFEHQIVAWDEVAATDGSGAVHIAPGCGEQDYDLGKKLGLPEICPIDENGVILPGYGNMSGQKTDQVKQTVFDALKERGKLYYTHKFKHSYPICWRCKSEIVFRLVESWFIEVDAIRPKLLEAVETVKWEPEFMKKRMQDWLNNMGDWNISRSRYYGVPLPIFVTEKGEVVVVGSKEELRTLAVEPEKVDALPELHRPYIDEIKIKSPKTGDIATRIPDVGDTWLDAGITPFSTNKFFTDKAFWEQNFPAEVVIEMREQIRLWFYSLLLMSVVLVGKAPYEKVIGHESVVQENGSRFSKSGYSISAVEYADTVGADTARYMYAGNSLTSLVRFSFNLGEDARRRLLGFWNSYTFFNTYAVIDEPALDGFVANEKDLTVTDKWLLEITNQFVKNSNKYYDNNETFNVVAEFEKLIDDISNFYIRTNRRRFWKNDEENDKLTAYYCLYTALKAITVVMAPILPFMSERIWQGMVREVEANAPESVMLADFPTQVTDASYAEMVGLVDITKQVITLAQRLRNENQIKVKQPLAKLYVVSHEEEVVRAMQVFEELVQDELNVKQVVVVQEGETFNDYYLTVNFKVAGRVLKGDVQKVKNLLEHMPQQQMDELLEQWKQGQVVLPEFGTFEAGLFEYNAKPKQDFVLTSEGNTTVVLDTILTPELVQEGLARELIRFAQVLRKEADFKIEARVLATIASQDPELAQVIELFATRIADEILANKLNQENFEADIEREVEISGKTCRIALKSL